MHRQSPPINPELEALLDERDHLQIQISLFADEGNDERRQAMLLKLAQLEAEIHRHWNRPTP